MPETPNNQPQPENKPIKPADVILPIVGGVGALAIATAMAHFGLVI